MIFLFVLFWWTLYFAICAKKGTNIFEVVFRFLIYNLTFLAIYNLCQFHMFCLTRLSSTKRDVMQIF